jgi:hypothetical protein
LKHIVILYLLPLKEHKQCIPISFIIPGREKDMLRLGHETEDSFYIKKTPNITEDIGRCKQRISCNRISFRLIS